MNHHDINIKKCRCEAESMLESVVLVMATIDQAIDALSETSKKYILKLAADRSGDTRSQLIDLAKTSAHNLYTRDWIEETTHMWGAIEADRDCYGDEVDQAQTEADETMRDIYTSIKFASPFLPAEYIIQTLLNGKINEDIYESQSFD